MSESNVSETWSMAGLAVKKKKCLFGCKECHYLSHIIGQGSVQPDECKLTAVKEYLQPKTKKHVRAFLGLAGYYRRFPILLR